MVGLLPCFSHSNGCREGSLSTWWHTTSILCFCYGVSEYKHPWNNVVHGQFLSCSHVGKVNFFVSAHFRTSGVNRLEILISFNQSPFSIKAGFSTKSMRFFLKLGYSMAFHFEQRPPSKKVFHFPLLVYFLPLCHLSFFLLWCCYQDVLIL